MTMTMNAVRTVVETETQKCKINCGLLVRLETGPKPLDPVLFFSASGIDTHSSGHHEHFPTTFLLSAISQSQFKDCFPTYHLASHI